MKKIVLALSASALMATSLSAAPPAASETGKKCRSEVMQLCEGVDGRKAMRGCVKENFSKLIDECQKFVIDMREKRKARKSAK